MPADRTLTDPRVALDLRTIIAEAEHATRLTRALVERDALNEPAKFIVALHERGAVLSRLREAHMHLQPLLRGSEDRPAVQTRIRDAVRPVAEAGEELLQRIGERKKEILDALHEVERREQLMKYVR
jgi:hypothetical protein